MIENEEQKVTIIIGVSIFNDVNYKPTLPDYNTIQNVQDIINIVKFAFELQPTEKNYENMSNEFEAAKTRKNQFKLIHNNNECELYVLNCDCDKSTKTIRIIASNQPQ